MDNRVIALIMKLRDASHRPTPESSLQLDAYFARYHSGAQERQQVTKFFPYSMYQEGGHDILEPR